jgi:hypothetical protein
MSSSMMRGALACSAMPSKICRSRQVRMVGGITALLNSAMRGTDCWRISISVNALEGTDARIGGHDERQELAVGRDESGAVVCRPSVGAELPRT